MKLISIIFIISQTLLAQHVIRPFSDSEIEGIPYNTTIENLRNLETSFPNNIEVMNYGFSTQGRPLIAVKIFTRFQKASKAVLISGATHGNEYLNIVDRLPELFINRLLESSYYGLLMDNPLAHYLASGGVVYLVPILNPDGYELDQRHNPNRVDLNRDFDIKMAGHKGFTQKETSQLSYFLDQEITKNKIPLKLTVDYHCCDGSLLYPWAYKKARIPAEDLNRHIVIGELMLKHIDSKYRHGITGEILGYYPIGTSKDHYYEKYGALAFTFEGKRRVENQNLEKHYQWWMSIFDFLLK